MMFFSGFGHADLTKDIGKGFQKDLREAFRRVDVATSLNIW